MARLVIKNGYLKGGKAAAHLHHLVKYIATRDGVEKVPNGRELSGRLPNSKALALYFENQQDKEVTLIE